MKLKRITWIKMKELCCRQMVHKLQPRTKLLRQFHAFCNFCAILPSPLERKSKIPLQPLFKVVLV